ncbi:MAG TPA: integrin alpha, partial [Polyangia bacterium]
VPNSERAHRAVVVGPLLASGPAVAIGVPGAAAPGAVVFYSVSGGATPAVACAGILNAPAPTDAAFGEALAVGDFDGDGLPDLLVGAPPNAVYLYRGPLTLPAVPTATVVKPANSAAFGTSLAALNLDGKKGDEALVGDPEVTLAGVNAAGDVTVYTGPTLIPLTAPPTAATVAPMPLVLTDHSPGAGEGYGSAVGGLPFCGAAPCTAATLTPLPLVGAPGAAFTYFTLGPVDPRVK